MKDIILWEEKNSTELMTKFENKPIFVQNDGITETKKEFVKKTCEDTGKKKTWRRSENKKIWKRNCPKCGKDIFHVEKWTRNRFQKDGRLCWSCNKSEDIKGKTFGYLIALERVGNSDGKCKSAKWAFRCVCGKEVVKVINSVKKGRGDNCGCKHGEKIIKTKGIKEYQWLFTKFKKECEKRKRDNTISFKEFLKFTQINRCHYCNSTINWSKHHPDCRRHLESHGYHLDRKNNDEDYSVENCVVCCNRCNFSKSDRFSYNEWYGMTQYLRNKTEA